MAVQQIVSEALKLLIEEDDEKPNDRLYVSELSSCLRKAWYERMKPAKKTVLQVLRMAEGRAIHEKIEEAFASLGCGVEEHVEVRLADGTIVAGKADIICNNYVIEIKTSENSHEPDEAMKRQAKYYAALFGLDEAYILIVSRRNGLITLHRVSYDREKTMEELEKRARILKNALESGKPPKPEPGPWCQTCPYRLQCPATRR